MDAAIPKIVGGFRQHRLCGPGVAPLPSLVLDPDEGLANLKLLQPGSEAQQFA